MGGDAAAVLQAIDEALDAAAERVKWAADDVPDVAVPLRRDLRHGAAVAQILPGRVRLAYKPSELIAKVFARAQLGSREKLQDGLPQPTLTAVRLAAPDEAALSDEQFHDLADRNVEFDCVEVARDRAALAVASQPRFRRPTLAAVRSLDP